MSESCCERKPSRSVTCGVVSEGRVACSARSGWLGESGGMWSSAGGPSSSGANQAMAAEERWSIQRAQANVVITRRAGWRKDFGRLGGGLLWAVSKEARVSQKRERKRRVIDSVSLRYFISDKKAEQRRFQRT